MKHFIAAASLVLAFSLNVHAQSVEIDDSNAANSQGQQTGKQKAGQYFQTRKAQAPAPAPKMDPALAPHYLAIHIGTFFSDQSYNWGEHDIKSDGGFGSGPGKFNGGVTYRMGEWVNSMDLSVRVEYTSYAFGESSARKLSFSPMITFPDAASRFPLYFGAGAGLGLFLQQVRSRSPLSLDWQVVLGVRFLDVFQNVGFMVESGIKNHAMLFSDGQYNGVFLNVGTVFAF